MAGNHSGEIRAINGELDFIKFVFARGWGRLQAREAIKAGDLPRAVTPTTFFRNASI
jgi:hypothetical protein